MRNGRQQRNPSCRKKKAQNGRQQETLSIPMSIPLNNFFFLPLSIPLNNFSLSFLTLEVDSGWLEMDDKKIHREFPSFPFEILETTFHLLGSERTVHRHIVKSSVFAFSFSLCFLSFSLLWFLTSFSLSFFLSFFSFFISSSSSSSSNHVPLSFSSNHVLLSFSSKCSDSSFSSSSRASCHVPLSFSSKCSAWMRRVRYL